VGEHIDGEASQGFRQCLIRLTQGRNNDLCSNQRLNLRPVDDLIYIGHCVDDFIRADEVLCSRELVAARSADPMGDDPISHQRV
jgi:hypothetical protein